jgi:hypothetical protein
MRGSTRMLLQVLANCCAQWRRSPPEASPRWQISIPTARESSWGRCEKGEDDGDANS